MSTEKIRLLLIIPTLDQSGAEKQLALLASGLDQQKFNVHVAVLTRDGPLSDILKKNNIPYTIIGKQHKISFAAYLKLKRLIKQLRPHIVHTWLFAANAYGRMAAIACKVPSIICGERCVDPWKSSLYFAIDRWLARKTNIIAANSEGIREFYVRHGLPPEKFVVIPNAVTPFPTSPWSREELLAQLGLESKQSGKPFLIGIVARLWPQKRIKEALWSFDQLKFAGLDFHALIIGDGPERENLLRYREELLLKDCVHFLGHQSEVYRFMPHFDLLWCTSAYEGQSNSILEAMSAGVPVLASDIPGNRELVVPGKTGILIPEFDGDVQRRRTAFTKETLELLKPDNAERRRRFGEAARQRIQNDFSLEKMIRQYAELYDNQVKQHE
ncbi:MAG: glycosyltransferase [Thermoguttaceae bacterium]|nr:glycosyltransferase [Thermoguttaceae bacterium]